MPSNHLILCQPHLLLLIFSSIRVFSNESVLCVRWPKYWSFSFNFSIRPSSEYSRLISFRIDWFDFLAVQGTLKSLLPSPETNARVFIATTTSPQTLSRFALGEAPGIDIRVPQEEPHVEEVAGWTGDLEPTPGPKSLLRGTAPGTVGSVG